MVVEVEVVGRILLSILSGEELAEGGRKEEGRTPPLHPDQAP